MDSLSPSRPAEGNLQCSSPVAAVTKSLLSTFMKASFSMSSLRDGISPEKECPGVVPATLPRRKHQEQLRSARAKDNKDDFWEALQPDYNYLMDHGLIDTCKEAKGELFSDSELETGDTWSFNEFFEQHDRMCAWVEHVEMEATRPEGVQESHLEQIKAFTAEVILLNEQSHRLIRRYPTMRDEIHQRIDHFNGLWEALQHCVAAGESTDEKAALRREIACQMRLLRKWIRGIEEQLGPLLRQPSWEASEIEARLVHHQELQKQIESRGKAVLTVIKLCERYRDQEQSGGDGERQQQHHFRGSTQALRTATNLQKRFHSLWLRSLEWQCWLEELRGGAPRHVFNPSKGDDSESDGRGDEPYRKYPRLTAGCRKPVAMDAVGGLRQSRDVGVAVGSDTADKGMMAGEPGGARRPPDHQDVGYSSENSAHLSNEESAGEFVRVYTYTSATATSPRVLEVVMDGDRRPRRALPRGRSAAAAAEERAADKMNVSDAGPNCATYYFRHEDSDSEHRPTSRAHLNFGRGLGEEGSERATGLHLLNTSDLEEYDEEEGDRPEPGRFPDEIHKLVNEVVVHRPGSEADAARRATAAAAAASRNVDSSCDASGEYTSSSSNESDADSSSSSASSSSQDQQGSVIHLKMSASTPVISAAESGSNVASDPGNNGVRMRTKKRRSGDRPWSVVELNKRSDEGRLNLSHFSNSETALHHLSPCRSVPKECASVTTEGESSPGPRLPRKSTARRRSSRRADSSSEDKCRSMGSLRHSSSSETGRRKSSSGLMNHSRSRGTHSDWADSESTWMERSAAVYNDADATMMAMDTEENSCFANTTDELSSLSEQAWDDYQDPPYLSEPYSEQVMGEDLVLRAWDMESPSDGTSTPSFPSKARARQRQGSTRATSNSRESSVLDSESDFEDVSDVIEQHRKQLQLTELQLKTEMEGDPSEPGRHRSTSEVLATCHTHLQCLKKVWEQLGVVQLKPLDLNLGVQRAGEQLKRGWEKLLMETKEHQARLSQLGQLQNEVKAFDQKVKLSLQKAAEVEKLIRDRSSVASVKRLLKEQALCLTKVKQDLTNLNFRIHNFVARTGLEVSYLKEEVVALYRLWDQAQDAISDKSVWIERVDNTWQIYCQQCDRLNEVLKEDEAVLSALAPALKTPLDLLSSAATPFAELSGAARMAELKEKLSATSEQTKSPMMDSGGPSDSRACLDDLIGSSEQLEKLLGSGPAAKEAALQCKRMGESVDRQQEKCQQLVVQMADVLKRRSLLETPEAAVQFRKSQVEGGSAGKCKKQRKRHKTSSSTLLWRVVRAALPFQLAVVILFCFACLLEPHCCDNVNNLNLSLTPQLRYVRGPPPI